MFTLSGFKQTHPRLFKSIIEAIEIAKQMDNSLPMKECDKCMQYFTPIDAMNFHCQKCQPCKPIIIHGNLGAF